MSLSYGLTSVFAMNYYPLAVSYTVDYKVARSQNHSLVSSWSKVVAQPVRASAPGVCRRYELRPQPISSVYLHILSVSPRAVASKQHKGEKACL